MEPVVGKHVFGELYDIVPVSKDDLEKIVTTAVTVARATLLKLESWECKGRKHCGVSVVAIVNESHIAVHTWNEERYATVDVYTCGEHTDAEAAFDYIVSMLQPRRYTKSYANRSQLK